MRARTGEVCRGAGVWKHKKGTLCAPANGMSVVVEKRGASPPVASDTELVAGSRAVAASPVVSQAQQPAAGGLAIASVACR